MFKKVNWVDAFSLGIVMGIGEGIFEYLNGNVSVLHVFGVALVGFVISMIKDLVKVEDKQESIR